MKTIYRVGVIIESKNFQIHFDTQDRAERFLNALQQILSEKGKECVSFKLNTIKVFDNDEEVINDMNMGVLMKNMEGQA